MGIDYKPYRERKVMSIGYTACTFDVYLGYFVQTLDQMTKRGPAIFLKLQKRLKARHHTGR